jgi:monofunctional biosynthetic peptidoglycan transglycosylase
MGESPVITRRFRVAGLSSEVCAARVEHALMALPGVEEAVVDLDRAQVVVWSDGTIPDVTLADAVERVGYTLILAAAEPEPEPEPPAPEPEPQPAPAPEPEPEPAPPPPSPPPPAPRPAPAPRIDRDDIIVEDEPERRSWVPSFGDVWYVATRTILFAFVASILWVAAYSFLPAPFTLVMVSESLFEGRNIRHQWVPLERISPHLIRAVIASEDNEFCHHWGFDFNELEKAWDRSQRNGGRLRGASTITQQTAKNAFLWGGRSYVRKGFEAYFTVLIEGLWSKRRTMEVYLNIIEWGPGVFGAEAAARHWFRKPASRLTQIEAARLAAILPNPARYRANPPGPYVNGRSYTIAARANSVDLNGDDRCAKP